VEIKIEKRSGRIEDFNEEKIVRSISRAGAKLAVAKEILENVKQHLEKEGSTLVKTAILKEYIRHELDKASPNISRTYWEYIKPTQLQKPKGDKVVGSREAKIRSKKTGLYDKSRF
jgi:2-phosphoglycerate kinase